MKRRWMVRTAAGAALRRASAASSRSRALLGWLARYWLILTWSLCGCEDYVLESPSAPVRSRVPATLTRTTSTPSRTERPAPTGALLPTVEASDVWAQVVQVVDGDTIRVEVNGYRYRVRLIGIDSPELEEYGYTEAAGVSEELCGGKRVRLVRDVSETDRYGRLLRYAYLDDGTFVNAELVRRGYAVAVTFPPDVRHAASFVQLQREAREAGRGLWGDVADR